MKVSLDRHELAEAINVAKVVVLARTPKAILQCVLLDAHKDFVLISATDLEISVRCSLTQVQVDRTGAAVVPMEKLSQIVQESADDVLTMEIQDDACHIRGRDSHFKIFTRPADEFPPVPEAEESGDFEVGVQELRRLGDWTVFAAARENTRYAINGVLWEKGATGLTMVATDGRRLSKAETTLKKSKGESRAIVPSKAMKVLAQVLTDPEGVVSVKMAKNQVLFRSAQAIISSAVLEGHFPNYTDVIPSGCERTANFATQELLSAVRRAGLLSTEESKGVKLSFSKGQVTLSSRTPEQGEAVIQLPVEYEQGDVSIGFNPKFLEDVLRVTKGETVRFEFSEPNRPGVFKDGDSFVYVVMPVNLS